MDVIERLVYFNLTRHEATLYMALLAEGSLTGYEAAKLTGISRSNTYTALAGLVDKGAAHVTEDTATRYTPVSFEEFCENKIRQMQEYKAYLIEKMPVAKNEVEGYITIKGAQAIMNKLKNMIAKAEARIYVSATGSLIEDLREPLAEAVKRGLKIVIITERSFVLPGATTYYAEKPNSQIRLIADSCKVLTGDLADGDSSTCLYSGKQNLVDLFKDALKNEIKLIELTNIE
ncbi:MAG: TrmB family transcriptional regulator [Negativicutes bacterium]|nr:TrmB family transcriptional regulator [Negativicutes bacterium]